MVRVSFLIYIIFLANLYTISMVSIRSANTDLGVGYDGGPEWSEVQWERMVRHRSALSGMEEALAPAGDREIAGMAKWGSCPL